MSHFTKVSTKIKDLTALKSAIKSMGLTMTDKAPCRYYSGAPVKENVCKLPGPYDMSFVKNSNGTYSIDADFYGGHVERVIGRNASKLMKAYTIEKLKLEAEKNRYCVRDIGNGKMKIYNPASSSGGYLEASIEEDGNISFKAKECIGKSCMQFKNLEEAFGVAEIKKTDEYYNDEVEYEYVEETGY